MSNEKQIGLAMMQYVQDNDETYPLSDWGGFWPQEIYPYVKSVNVFKCPSNSDANSQLMGQQPTVAGLPNNIPVSYGMNNFIGESPASSNARIAQTIAYIREPASKILVCERIAGDNNQDGIGWTDWDLNAWEHRMYAGHTGRFNAIFADGHAKAMKPTQTNTPINMWGDVNNVGSNSGPCDVDPYTADNNSINCDQPSQLLAIGMGALETNNQ